MSRASLSKAALPNAARAAVGQLGRDLAAARRRRRIPQRLLAARMLVSEDTLRRLEKGDPTVGLHALAGALWALGLLDRLSLLADPAADLVGAAEELARLPQRIRAKATEPDLDF